MQRENREWKKAVLNEFSLLRIVNDLSVDSDICALLVLLDLSAAFEALNPNYIKS